MNQGKLGKTRVILANYPLDRGFPRWVNNRLDYGKRGAKQLSRINTRHSFADIGTIALGGGAFRRLVDRVPIKIPTGTATKLA